MAQDLKWVLYRSAAYLRGRGMTFGSPLLPAAAINPDVYSVSISLLKSAGISGVGEDFSIFADNSLDHVLVTPMIAACHNPAASLKEMCRKLKVGGHLITLIRVDEVQPGVAELKPEMIDEWVGDAAKWVKKARYQEPNSSGWDVCLQIYKKTEGRRGFWEPKPKTTKPRVCVVRYGALGDAIVMTPLLRKLHEDGYDVTLNINPYCKAVIENNPHIDNLLVQERDAIPNPLLGEYWDLWSKDYDKYVNLCESIEGDLLLVEGRPDFFTSKEWRHKTCNKNYYDYTLARGGYSGVTGLKGELFFTNAEERRAREFFDTYRDKFLFIWALNGSSHHKIYPMMEPVMRNWFERHPDSIGITVGDTLAQLMEFPHKQLVPKAGIWSIRESLISAKYANLVIGPETMMTNAAGCYATPKITILSHSSHENLCKYWENDYHLEPSQETAPCYPCHQLHYTKESCPTGEMRDTDSGEILGHSPICSMGVDPHRMLDRMEEVYVKWSNTVHGRAKTLTTQYAVR